MRIRSSIALGAALTLTACAINPETGQPGLASSVKDGLNSTFNSDDPCANNDRNIGLVLGTVTGVAVGYLAHGVKGAVVGGAVGAAGGYLIGHALDSRRCELSKIAAANGLKLMSAPITQPNDTVSASGAKPANNSATELGLDVQVQNKGDEFAPGTAELTPQARTYMGQIAAQYSPKTLLASLPADATPAQRVQALSRKVMIVGHTDEHDAMTGTDLATLSQERAKTVAKLFVDQGVPAENIYYQGAGDTLPIASNATSDGREANQRTQIVDVPTESDLQKFLARRTANPANTALLASRPGRPQGACQAPPVRCRRPKHHLHLRLRLCRPGPDPLRVQRMWQRRPLHGQLSRLRSRAFRRWLACYLRRPRRAHRRPKHQSRLRVPLRTREMLSTLAAFRPTGRGFPSVWARHRSLRSV